MINMMYLVLITLLALNVSNEVLKAFHLFEVGFNQSRNDFQANITNRLAVLGQESQNQPVLRPYYERALKAHQISDEFVQYIDDVINDLEELTGGRKDREEASIISTIKTELVQADNMERHANYFLVDNSAGTKGWRAKLLEQRINETRLNLVQLLKPDEPKITVKQGVMQELDSRSPLRAELRAEDQGDFESWSGKYLERTPLAAVMSLLTKMQSDARSLESSVIDELARGKVVYHPIEKLVPVVSAPSSAILLGEEYTAEVFLAAKTAGWENNSYELEGGKELTTENGVGLYSEKPNTIGIRQIKGVIRVNSRDGDQLYPFKTEYQVFNGQAAISADAMNILYIGVKNPITIAVPGVNPQNVIVNISSGNLARQEGNKYIANVSNTGQSIITVSARLSNGTTKLMGRSVYRVRNLPKPEAIWGVISNTKLSIPKQVLLTQNNIIANMGEDFAFGGNEVKYLVERFRFVYVPKRNGNPEVIDVTGSAITQGLKNIIQSAKTGDQIIIANVVAIGPDGRRRLNTITFTIS